MKFTQIYFLPPLSDGRLVKFTLLPLWSDGQASEVYSSPTVGRLVKFTPLPPWSDGQASLLKYLSFSHHGLMGRLVKFTQVSSPTVV